VFEGPRRRYSELMDNPDELEKELIKGAQKATVIANTVLNRVREKVGFRKI
jgi:tryptophanyl-tRNA synthetase